MRRWATAAVGATVLALVALTAWWALDEDGGAGEGPAPVSADPGGASDTTKPAPRTRAARPDGSAAPETETAPEESRLSAVPEGFGVFLFPVAVRVVDRQGQPVAGADVLLCEPRAPGPSAFTDAEGRVRFEGRDARKAPRGFEVRVRAKGFADLTAKAWAGLDETRLVVLRDGRIEGVVVDDDGGPVADAAVSGFGAHATTDWQGRFALEPAAPGEDEVLVVAGTAPNDPGKNEPAFWGGKRVVLGDAETLRDVRVVLRTEQSFVTAEVVEEDGSRGAAKQIRLIREGQTLLRSLNPTASFVVTAPAGTRVRLQAVAQDAAASAAGAGRSRRVAVLDTVTDPAPGAVRRLVLARPVRVTFRVIGPDGAPVSFPCGVDIAGPDQTFGGATFWGSSGEVEAFADPASPLRVLVSADTVGGTVFALDAPGADGRIYEVRLPRMASVRGRLTDAKGAPLADRWVVARTENGPAMAAASAKDGSFVIAGLIDGAYALLVAPTSALPPARLQHLALAGCEFTVAGGRDVDLGTIVAWSEATLRGRVTGPGGRAVAAACVTVTTVPATRRIDCVTDLEGRFEVRGLAGPQTRVTVERPGLGTEVRHLDSVRPDAADVAIRLSPSGSARVQLAEASWLMSSVVTARRASGGPAWSPAGGDRRVPAATVFLTDLPADDLILSIQADSRTIERRVAVRAGETTDVRFDRTQ